jgi:hypothetical protein
MLISLVAILLWASRINLPNLWDGFLSHLILSLLPKQGGDLAKIFLSWDIISIEAI